MGKQQVKSHLGQGWGAVRRGVSNTLREVHGLVEKRG